MTVAFSYQTTAQSIQIEIKPTLKGGTLHRLMGLLFVVVRLAHKPELLVELKGPSLSVLLALALRANKEGSCFPSIDRLMMDTGYSRSSVCNALNKLEKAGFVNRVRRQRQSTLYELQPFKAGASEKSDSPEATVEASKKSPQRREVASIAPAPSESVPAPDKTREKATTPTQHGESGSGVTHTSEPPHQMHFDEWTDVKRRMQDLGIAEAVVHEVIRRQQGLGRSPRYVEAWVKAYMEGLEAQRIKGPGWLVTALRNDWELPAAFREMALTDEERRRRYITGKFAEYIKY